MTNSSARFCAGSRSHLCAMMTGLLLAGSTANAAIIYALTDENDLLTFDSAAPEDLISGGAISNLNQDLIGIDIRPSTGQLYGIGNLGGMFIINPTTRVATGVGNVNVPLVGSRFGIDFNPVVDRLRLVSDLDQNLRVDVTFGSATVDSPLQYGPAQPGATGDNPNVVGSAYTNSYAGATTTTLYGIDVRSSEDRLIIQNPPNAGTLTVVGPLGINASSLQGFDILSIGSTNTAFAAMQSTALGISQLFSINLSTGAATLIGDIGGGDLIDGLAVVGSKIPEPASLSMAAFALIGGVLARRRGR